ncbi:hypothetical protein WDV85_14725 [Pseudokineococcus sp. 5B2Z-1]|uniref:hypothetical protein n=1 Tax=Pseudokineococcus sp. 5B2Z-1 TaxID=3132744 RepID=UPI0030B48B73
MTPAAETLLDRLAQAPDVVTDPELPVESVRGEIRDGPSGSSLYVLVNIAGTGGADWDLDAAYRVRQRVRQRVADLEFEGDVVVVLASGDPDDAPSDEDDV